MLCDIDGVLRRWPSAHDLEQAHGLPAGAFAPAAFAPVRLQPAITGQVTDEQWRGRRWPRTWPRSPERARIAVAAWSALLPAIDTDVVALLAQTCDVASVVMVSNATTRLEADLEQQGLAGLADVVVNIARVGVAKPDHRIYLVAAQRVGVAPDRRLFIDDTAVNVAAAREFGMAAAHYRRTKDLRDALAPLINQDGPVTREP